MLSTANFQNLVINLYTPSITRRLEDFSLNTVVSGFMEFNNKFIELAKKEGGIDKETIQTFVTLLAPFAPHIGEEFGKDLETQVAYLN